MKIHVSYTDVSASNITVHTGMSYEMQPVSDIIVKE
jgi:hypothetical protein